jgi:uncharacterized protein YcbK (DUF882 family)
VARNSIILLSAMLFVSLPSATWAESSKDRSQKKLFLDQQLTRSFKIKHFHVGCPDLIPKVQIENLCRLAKNLQVVQDALGKKRRIRIISGYRSPRCNRWARGAKRSQHMLGKAVDMRVRGMSSRRLHRVFLRLIKKKKIEQGGLGLYRRHVHYDVRGKKSRWRRVSTHVGMCYKKKSIRG